MAKRESFYRRDPGAALAGMAGMSLEERGAYNTVIDLLYLTWRPIEDNRAYIAGHCGCAVQKLNPIIGRLIAAGKLLRFEEDGQAYISNRKFEDERLAVKGVAKSRSGRAGVEEKSGEVEEKSASVGENPPGCDDKTALNQGDAPLEKSREEQTREKSKNPVATGDDGPLETSAAKPPAKQYLPQFDAAWKAYPHAKGRGSKKDSEPAWKKAAQDVGSATRLHLAIEKFAKEGREPRMDCGAMAMERWLRGGLYEHWLSPITPAVPAAFVKVTEEVQQQRLEWFKAKGEWLENWGARPISRVSDNADQRIVESGDGHFMADAA